MASLTNYSCPNGFATRSWHLGALGTSGRADGGRLVCAQNVSARLTRLQDHLARYGHPSTNGWKDIIPLWKAEQWDPERLMALYKKPARDIRQHGRPSR